jgi:hypothetical protein
VKIPAMTVRPVHHGRDGKTRDQVRIEAGAAVHGPCDSAGWAQLSKMQLELRPISDKNPRYSGVQIRTW